jgi:soluble epoxide hydrolase/lipid-phosphate phosphatase
MYILTNQPTMTAHPLRHSTITLSTGIAMHIVECFPPPSVSYKGTIIMIHGFPDTWYGWRNQIRPIANEGYHVVVPDQRGYGDTITPAKMMKTEDFRMEQLCNDNLALLDALGVKRAIFLGHDWGGTLVWNMCLHHRHRCSAVGAICTPFFANNPTKNPWVDMRKPEKVGRFDYQVITHVHVC